MNPDITIAVRAFLVLLAMGGLGVVCCGWRSFSRDAFRQKAFAAVDQRGDSTFPSPDVWRGVASGADFTADAETAVGVEERSSSRVAEGGRQVAKGSSPQDWCEGKN